MRRTSLLSLLGALLAGPAAAQEVVDPIFRLDFQTRVQIQGLRDSAFNLGLPTKPIESLALQGHAMKVEGKLIVQRVRAYIGQLAKARQALGPAASSSELEAAASAIEARIPINEVAQFRPVPGMRSPAGALVMLADLVTVRGVPWNEATPALHRLWREGAEDADFQELWRRVDQDIHSGVSPGVALLKRVREYPGRGPGKPVTRPPENPSS